MRNILILITSLLLLVSCKESLAQSHLEFKDSTSVAGLSYNDTTSRFMLMGNFNPSEEIHQFELHIVYHQDDCNCKADRTLGIHLVNSETGFFTVILPEWIDNKIMNNCYFIFRKNATSSEYYTYNPSYSEQVVNKAKNDN